VVCTNEIIDGSTFRLAFGGETTAPLDYDATAAEIETVLEELNAVDQITITGSAGGPWTVTFAGTQAATDVSSIMGDATGVTNGTLLRTTTFVGGTATVFSDPSGLERKMAGQACSLMTSSGKQLAASNWKSVLERRRSISTTSLKR